MSSCAQRTILTESELLPTNTGGKVWFVRSEAGKLSYVGVERKTSYGQNELETSVRTLLDGPTREESEQGIGSEIPRGTVLLSLSEKNGCMELDLSRRFAAGGGIDSIETRLEQLGKTVSSAVGEKPVFLNIEGQRLTMTPGEGIEIKQPINR